jgi:hypothetical protein
VSLEKRARGWRFQARRAALADAAVASFSGAAFLFGSAALADRAWSLPREARFAVLAATCAWGALTSWQRLVAPWRRTDWTEVLSRAGRRWPTAAAELRSAWELRASAAAPGTSRELREEHLARADRTADSLPPAPLFVWTPTPREKVVAAFAVVVLGVSAAWSGAASWRRVVAPWRDVGLDAWVLIEPGDARPDWGAAVLISATPREGTAPAGLGAGALTLETRGADGLWRALDWTGPAQWRSESLSAPLTYRVSWRDMATRAYHLEPVAPPRWSRAEAVVRGRRGERRFELGSDAAVLARRGDWVAIEAAAAEPLSGASLRLSDRPDVVALRADGRSYKGGFFARQDAAMTFILVTEEKRRDPAPPAYPLTVAADAPPTAELLSPLVPLVAAPDDSVLIAYAARDDSSLASLTLRYQTDGGPVRSVPLESTRLPNAEILGDYSWALNGLKPGTRAQFWIEAVDDAVPPQTGSSEKGFVDIVDAASDHAAALAAREAADEAADRAAKSADAAREALAGGDPAKAAEGLGKLRADWKSAAAALEKWAKLSAEDLRAEGEVAADAARAADDFNRAGEEGLPAAEAALAQADAERASREEAALADQARDVLKNMREGAKAQEVQDFARRMSDAGREGEMISAAAKEMAQRGSSGTVSSAELEKLERSLDEVEKALEDLRQAVKNLPEAAADAGGEGAELPLDSARGQAGELRRALQSGDVAAAARAAQRLTESLKTLARSLASSGRRSADARSRRRAQEASKVAEAWRAAVETQTAAVESARRVENARTAELLRLQKSLVAEMRGRFAQLKSSAAAAGLGGMLDDADRLLQEGNGPGAARRLRSGGPAFSAEAERLERGPAPPAADAAGASKAADAQAAALARARSLKSEIEAAASSAGGLAARALKTVDDAARLEEAGEKALRGADSSEGLRRAEEALALLEQGDQDARSQASSAGGGEGQGQQSGGESGAMSMTAVRRRGGGGAAGARLERVKLPSAEDYRPPKELRDELRKTLSEPRPAAADAAVKEYLKRLAR